MDLENVPDDRRERPQPRVGLARRAREIHPAGDQRRDVVRVPHVAQRCERDRRLRAHAAPPQIGVGGAPEIFELEVHPRRIAPERRALFVREVEHLEHVDRSAPRRGAVVPHDRDDHRQSPRLRVIAEKRVPEQHRVLEQPERHERIGARLVLEQEQDPRVASRDVRGEDEVRVERVERLVDVARRRELQRREVDEGRDLGRQRARQRCGRDRVIREEPPEERVVRRGQLSHARA